MNLRLLIVWSLAFLATGAGCAGVTDCTGDWYQRGWSDGRYGSFSPQADLYAKRCASVDVAEYDRGWRDGAGARPSLGGM